MLAVALLSTFLAVPAATQALTAQELRVTCATYTQSLADETKQQALNDGTCGSYIHAVVETLNVYEIYLPGADASAGGAGAYRY
jgi:hypothetical protein